MNRIEFPANCPPVPEEQLVLSEPQVSVDLIRQTASVSLYFREATHEYRGTGKDRKMVPVIGCFRYVFVVRPTSGYDKRATAAWFDGPLASDPDSWGVEASVEGYTHRFSDAAESTWCEEKDSLTGRRGSRTKIYTKAKTIAMRGAREAVEASVRSETPQILTLAMLAAARENVRRCATALRDDLTEDLADTERPLYNYSFEHTQQLCTELAEAQAAAASLAALVARLGYATREDD